jgi:hypothetical protein
MQAPVIPNASDLRRKLLGLCEEKEFFRAVKLTAKAAYLGSCKAAGNPRSEAGGWTLSLILSIFGLDEVAAVGEMSKHSASYKPSKKELENPHRHLKEAEMNASHPTFAIWSEQAQEFYVRVNKVAYRTAFTRAWVHELLDLIQRGVACSNQVQKGEQGNTRKEVKQLLREAENRANSILERSDYLIYEREESEREAEQLSRDIEKEVRKNLGSGKSVFQD